VIGTPRPFLPPDVVRHIDSIARAIERTERLCSMNEGNLGVTLLHAAGSGGLQDVRFLLAAGADAGAERGYALYNACFGGHLQVAEALINAGGTLTPELHNIGLLPAAAGGSVACCQLLLERGADVRFGNDSAVAQAARYGRLETVAFLLDHGADAWSADALRLATEHKYEAVVALLMARRGEDDGAQ